MLKHRFAALSALAVACCAVPGFGATPPGVKEITIAAGWGVPFHGESVYQDNQADWNCWASASGKVGYSKFNPAWGTLIAKTGGGLHTIQYSWDVTDGQANNGHAQGSISGWATVSADDTQDPDWASSGGNNNTQPFSFSPSTGYGIEDRDLTVNASVGEIQAFGLDGVATIEGMYSGSIVVGYEYTPANSFTGNGGGGGGGGGGSTNWNDPGNWIDNNGNTIDPPNGACAFAGLYSTASSHTINLDVPVTLGTILFDDPTTPFTINGPSALTMDCDEPGASVSMIVENGTHTIAADVNLVKDTTISVNNSSDSLTLSGALNASGVATTKNGAGTLTVNNVRASALNVQYGAVKVALNGGTSKVNSLNIAQPLDPTDPNYDANSGQLDLANNNMVVDYAPTDASPIGTWSAAESKYTGLTGLIEAGDNGGMWNGRGITSSAAAGQSQRNLTELGIGEASEVLGLSGSQTATWEGQTVDATSVLVKYTYGGDANLDGKLTIDDYGIVDGNIGKSGTVFGWTNGDFNYDGKINIDDEAILDQNFPVQGNPLAIGTRAASLGVNAMPEPATTALLGCMAGAFLRRRRRQCGIV